MERIVLLRAFRPAHGETVGAPAAPERDQREGTRRCHPGTIDQTEQVLQSFPESA